jgi:hypothetical protein
MPPYAGNRDERPPVVRRNTRAAYLGHKLADGGLEEIGGVAGVPAAEPLLELELHEMACDGGDEHVAGMAADGVVELENAVVRGPPRPRLHPARSARQDLRHGLRHRWLLRNAQHADRAAAAAMHRERRGRRSRWGMGNWRRTGEGREVSGWILNFFNSVRARGVLGHTEWRLRLPSTY